MATVNLLAMFICKHAYKSSPAPHNKQSVTFDVVLMPLCPHPLLFTQCIQTSCQFFASLVELPSLKNNGSIVFQWHDGRRCTKARFSESECVIHDRLVLHAFYSLSFTSAQAGSISILVSHVHIL